MPQNRMIEKARRALGDPLFVVLIGFLLLLGTSGVLAATGQIREMVTGEPLYDLMFADRLPFPQNILMFFENRVEARLMHGVLITLLYRLFGFNPPLFYWVVLLLIIISATAIVLLLRDHIKRPWQILVLMFVLFLLPTLIPESTSLKKLGHTFAWASFWMACLFFQTWIRSRKVAWLAVSSVSFLAAMLSYEVIALLLPVAIFVSMKDIKTIRDFYKYLAASFFISVISSVLALSLALSFQGMGARVPSLSLGKVLAFPFISVFSVPFSLLVNGLGVPLAFSPPIAILAEFITLALLFFGLWIFIGKLLTIINNPRSMTTQPESWLAVAGLWLIFASYTPFLFVEQAPNEDNLVGVGFGIVFLLVLLSVKLRGSKWMKLETPAFVSISLFLIVAGWIGYQTQLATTAALEQRFATFVLSLKELVPGVKENSTFILVNANWGRTGCIGYMNMLYQRNQLHCIHLLDGDTEESYTFSAGSLVEDTGRVFGPDFIILTSDSAGRAELLETIKRGDYPYVPLTVQDGESISTNHERILSSSGPPSAFYSYVIKLAQK